MHWHQCVRSTRLECQNKYFLVCTTSSVNKSIVLLEDRENVKLLVAICNFSSVANPGICIALLYVLSTFLIDATPLNTVIILILIYNT